MWDYFWATRPGPWRERLWLTLCRKIVIHQRQRGQWHTPISLWRHHKSFIAVRVGREMEKLNKRQSLTNLLCRQRVYRWVTVVACAWRNSGSESLRVLHRPRPLWQQPKAWSMVRCDNVVSPEKEKSVPLRGYVAKSMRRAWCVDGSTQLYLMTLSFITSGKTEWQQQYHTRCAGSRAEICNFRKLKNLHHGAKACMPQASPIDMISF